MAIVINIYYSGTDGSARKFAEEMVSTGVVDRIRKEEGNIRYDYFFPMDDEETVLLIDAWKDQEALDVHHGSPMMNEILKLREKYDLKMKVERFISADDAITENDKKFIKN
ncbi:MAG: antibiotic biosynthesis monooxygenase [Erysipelotrichaceae bacterium]|nr:antibiotic biosynthesis monooxygenase [Erysipelotrichaceae bacterium]